MYLKLEYTHDSGVCRSLIILKQALYSSFKIYVTILFLLIVKPNMPLTFCQMYQHI